MKAKEVPQSHESLKAEIEPNLTPEEMKTIVAEHLKMIRGEAMSFLNGRHDLKLEDLTNSGVVGAMEAARRFDPSRNYQFYTYAQHWVRREIINAIINGGRTIKLNSHVHDYSRQLQTYRHELGPDATLEELHEKSGIAKATILSTQRASSIRVTSLQKKLRSRDNESRTLEDTIPDTSVRNPETDFTEDESSARVHESLEILSQTDPVASHVLSQRFGIANDNEISMAEIGRRLQLSRERIRQLNQRGMRKFRKIHEKKHQPRPTGTT